MEHQAPGNPLTFTGIRTDINTYKQTNKHIKTKGFLLPPLPKTILDILSKISRKLLGWPKFLNWMNGMPNQSGVMADVKLSFLMAFMEEGTERYNSRWLREHRRERKSPLLQPSQRKWLGGQSALGFQRLLSSALVEWSQSRLPLNSSSFCLPTSWVLGFDRLASARNPQNKLDPESFSCYLFAFSQPSTHRNSNSSSLPHALSFL